jgi:hypothetical protein
VEIDEVIVGSIASRVASEVLQGQAAKLRPQASRRIIRKQAGASH